MLTQCLEGRRFAHVPGPAGISLCIAAGPFTTTEDMGYAPLAELLAGCEARRPDVLLLLGPFVDVEHPAVASGALDVPFEALFQTQVLSKSISPAMHLHTVGMQPASLVQCAGRSE